MTIIACEECAREVSDKAASCPNCGVSISAPVREPRRTRRWLPGILIVTLLAWGTLTTLWLLGFSPPPKQLVGLIGARNGPDPSVTAPAKAVTRIASPIPPTTFEFKPVNGALYRTSVEQLNQEYDANEVAIQNRIGDGPVRLSGTVAEINEDTSGHPVVTLHTGPDSRADMLLTDDQKSAAAQLSKEDSVEIQCTKMQRIAARLHGSGCALVLVDAGAKVAYLAVSVAGKTGNPLLYIAGPMSRQTCLGSSDTIAVQMISNPTGERIVSKSCAATARESILREGCHLNSTMSAIPDIPTAHLWRYDCTPPGAEARKGATTASSRGIPTRAAAPGAAVAVAALSQRTPPHTESDAPAMTPDEKPAGPDDRSTKPVDKSGSAAVAPPDPVNANDEGGPPKPTPVAAPASAATTQPPAAADDLASVRTKDPQAADRIAAYCGKITSAASDPTTVAARCRRDELGAWNRLIVQNEFPNLDETSRRKCNEPPFPDSFVARESCAKYQLRLN